VDVNALWSPHHHARADDGRSLPLRRLLLRGARRLLPGPPRTLRDGSPRAAAAAAIGDGGAAHNPATAARARAIRARNTPSAIHHLRKLGRRGSAEPRLAALLGHVCRCAPWSASPSASQARWPASAGTRLPRTRPASFVPLRATHDDAPTRTDAPPPERAQAQSSTSTSCHACPLDCRSCGYTSSSPMSSS
jgi:hypothetical protein